MDFPATLLIFNLGTSEILFIILIVILLFGAQKIPDLARSLGRAQKEFQKARQDLEEEASPKTMTEDDKVRKAAKDLGIPTDGRPIDAIRKDISERVKT